MDDLTSREEEKRLEQARERGRKEEQDRQRERELAAEKGREKGLEEERAREKARQRPSGGWGMGTTIIALLFVLVIIVAVIALLSLSVSVMSPSTSYAMPFTTNYAVTFPEGQSIAIGNSRMSVLSFENELISDIDGDREKLVVGEDRVISERRAVITTLGTITLMDTNFKINLKYKGNRDNLAYFDMAIHTSQQVPDLLLKQLLPREINAQPM